MNIAYWYSHVWGGMFTKFHITLLHSFVISYIVVTNCAKAFSIGVDEFIVSLDLTMPSIGRLICSMVMTIELHDPIITFEMFIFAIIIGFHIIQNMLWVYKHVTQPSTMWSISCFKIMNDILFLNNVCARCLLTIVTLYGCHNGSFSYIP